jgi:hypothetical protein
MNVGTLSGLRVYPFDGAGIAYGILAIFQRRAYVFGASQRGIFYRIGAKIFNPCQGYFDSTFALKTKVGEVDLMLKVGMRDEIIPCWFRPRWIHGSIHLKRTGCISFIFTAVDPEVFPKSKGANVEDFATALLYGDGFYDKDNKERKQLDSY